MAFLSKLFGSSKSKSKPAKPTKQQLALQEQAVQVGGLQIGNIQRQTDFQQNLFAQIMASLEQRQGVNRSLFGGAPPAVTQQSTRRDEFLAKQQTDLEAFKRSLSGSDIFRQ